MSAIPTFPGAIGHADFRPPAAPDVNAIGYALALNGHAEVATGTVYRPLADAGPEVPEAGELFTPSERRAIALAADANQRAGEALAEVRDGLERAEAQAAGAAMLPPPPDEVRAAALAFLTGEATSKPGRQRATALSGVGAATHGVTLSKAEAARAALPGLRALVAERDKTLAETRGALRVAILNAASAARLRAAARWHALALEVGEAAGALAGTDALLGRLVGDTKLDPCGIWRRASQLVAAPPELRPKGTRVQDYLSRECAFLADGPMHDAVTARHTQRTEHALRKLLADVVPWPF